MRGQAVPDLGDLHDAVTGVIGEAGYDRKTRARLRALADARFGPLRAGSAGRFLHGGHPADLGALLRRPAVLAVHGIGAAEDRALVSGALLIRLAEHLRLRSRAAGSAPGHVLVIGEARAILRDQGEGQPATDAAEWFAALLAEFGAYGEGTVLTEPSPARQVPDVSRNAAARIVHRMPAVPSAFPSALPSAVPSDVPSDVPGPGAGEQAAGRALLTPEVAVLLTGDAEPPRWGRSPGPAAAPSGAAPLAAAPPLSGRRSAACGRQCRDGRACRLAELREAELLATAPELAWLRVSTGALLLAFLTDNPLPAVPAPLRRRWRALAPRARECLLARIVDQQTGIRAVALRRSYDPSRFAQVVASAAAIRLDRADAAAVAGPGTRIETLAGEMPSAIRPGPRLGDPAASLAARDRAAQSPR